MTDRLEEIKREVNNASHLSHYEEMWWLIEAVEGLRDIFADYALADSPKIQKAIKEGWVK